MLYKPKFFPKNEKTKIVLTFFNKKLTGKRVAKGVIK